MNNHANITRRKQVAAAATKPFLALAVLAVAITLTGAAWAAVDTTKGQKDTPASTSPQAAAASRGVTIGQFAANLQKLVPNPAAVTPAEFTAAVRKAAGGDPTAALKWECTINLSYPPFGLDVNCKLSSAAASASDVGSSSK